MAYKNICVLGLNFINIILITKLFFCLFFFLNLKRVLMCWYGAMYFTKLSVSILLVFSSLARSTTDHKKINTVCKIRYLHTHSQTRPKWSGLKTCFGVLKVKAVVILRQPCVRRVSEALLELCEPKGPILTAARCLWARRRWGMYPPGQVFSVKLCNMLHDH